MKMYETLYKVSIYKIKIDDRYFSFNYKIMQNGVLKKEGTYESDHCWKDNKPLFRRHKKGW